MTRMMVALLLAAWSAIAHAQQYPNRPIRLIVAIAAGSVTDVIMRAAAAELQARLGQPLVIENQGGASGIIAAKACTQAPPDGYTLCIINHAHFSYNQLMFTKLPYDPDDLVPVARLFMLIEGVFVNPGLGVNSFADLEKLAKAKPDSLNYATLGEGSFPEMYMRWLNNQWGVNIVGIPYKGGGPAAQAVAAGDVQMTRFGVGNFLGLIEAGKVKALAVSTAARSPTLPDVPTMVEAGQGGYPGRGWWGVAAPKGTPPAIVERLSREFGGLFGDPKFVPFLEKQWVISAPTTPEGFAEFIKEDRKAAEILIKIANTRKTEFKE